MKSRTIGLEKPSSGLLLVYLARSELQKIGAQDLLTLFASSERVLSDVRFQIAS